MPTRSRPLNLQALFRFDARTVPGMFASGGILLTILGLILQVGWAVILGVGMLAIAGIMHLAWLEKQ